MKEYLTPKKGTRYIFFSGKGGVGKSTMSCATALWLATSGHKTLLVTTDPAPNVGDIFAQEVGPKITRVHENLDAIEIDPDQAAEEYKEKVLEPMKDVLDEQTIKTTKQQMDSPCVEEVAAFDKFVEFLDDPKYDVVVFDTAPTGHTIRLLQLPQGWSEEIGRGGATCIGPSENMQGAKTRYDKAVAYLTDPDKTSFLFVMRPEESSLLETVRSGGELEKLGIRMAGLIVNGVLPKEACTIEFYQNKRLAQQEIIRQAKEKLDTEVITYEQQSVELNGKEMLQAVAENVIEQQPTAIKAASEETIAPPTADREAFIRAMRPADGTRYVFVTGKGGVGKSTFACTTALWLAQQGVKTLVVTTDPASHLQTILGTSVDSEPTMIVENLYAARVDQAKALQEYKERIMRHVIERFENSAVHVDIEATKKKIEEELKSPCSEEMAAFEKFMSYFEITGYGAIIIDTAPTGHTLRLLELPTMWKGFLDLGTLTKDTNQDTKEKYGRIIDIMKNPDKSTFAFVMYPEYTPIMEAHRASEELQRQVGIKTGAVVANFIIPPEHATNDYFKSRLQQQNKYLKLLKERFSAPLLLMPVLEEEPRGLEHLKTLAQRTLD
jgi:arsenite/tail-anchored protein-transporting ATPase